MIDIKKLDKKNFINKILSSKNFIINRLLTSKNLFNFLLPISAKIGNKAKNLKLVKKKIFGNKE